MTFANPTTSLLAISLSAAVPLRIMEYERRGGPVEADFARAGEVSQLLAEKGDVLMYGYKDKRTPKGEPSVAHIFNALADAIAVLAFYPGGVRTFGMHFEGKLPDGA